MSLFQCCEPHTMQTMVGILDCQNRRPSASPFVILQRNTFSQSSCKAAPLYGDFKCSRHVTLRATKPFRNHHGGSGCVGRAAGSGPLRRGEDGRGQRIAPGEGGAVPGDAGRKRRREGVFRYLCRGRCVWRTCDLNPLSGTPRLVTPLITPSPNSLVRPSLINRCRCLGAGKLSTGPPHRSMQSATVVCTS